MGGGKFALIDTWYGEYVAYSNGRVMTFTTEAEAVAYGITAYGAGRCDVAY